MTFENEKTGFLFPGQGAQAVGMGKDLCEAFLSARKIYERADEVLGFSISKLSFEGPEENLMRTLNAQPAIYVMSYVSHSILKEKFPKLEPAFTAGLSLGEFSALTAAGAITFEDGLRLVKIRAEAMEEAAARHPGTMASILGLSQTDCEALSLEAGCEVANLNAPDQIVLSGTLESVEKGCQLAEARGARRAIRLKVGGAFHSSLMSEARDRLHEALIKTPIQAPSCTFVPNASAVAVSDPEKIRELLSRQLTSPVRWVETMVQARASGVVRYLEVGPGRVLKGLVKKTHPELQVMPCGTVPDFEKFETSDQTLKSHDA